MIFIVTLIIAAATFIHSVTRHGSFPTYAPPTIPPSKAPFLSERILGMPCDTLQSLLLTVRDLTHRHTPALHPPNSEHAASDQKGTAKRAVFLNSNRLIVTFA